MEEIEKKKKVRKIKEEDETSMFDVKEQEKVEEKEIVIPKEEKMETFHYTKVISAPQVPKNKKEYIVAAITPVGVIYIVGENKYSFTKNIWGRKLRAGDKISL